MPTAFRKPSLTALSAATLVLLVAAYLRLHLLAEVPFGWHPDEATKAIMAWEIVLGRRPLAAFYPSFTGREPLYIFLEALAIMLFGRTTFSVRVLSAFIGLLTVAGTYQLGRRLFNRRVAWIAAGLMAVSVWHLIASRNGYRAVLQPLVQLPSLILLWRGLRFGRVRDYALAGAFVGLAQYTYSAARFFPVMLLVFGVGVLVVRRADFKAELPRWAIMGAMALVVFVPLGVYFLQNPGDLFNRANQISVFNTAVNGGDTQAALLRNLRDTTLMFFRRGDPNFRFNQAGRAVYSRPEAVLFGLGLLLAGWRLVRERGERRLAYLLLWSWLLMMLLPMALTVEGIPYFQRALGIVPVVYFFPALAMDWLLGLVSKRLGDRSAWRLVERVGLGLGLLALALLARRVYFIKWAGSQTAYHDRRLELSQLAEYINVRESDSVPYISTDQGSNPVMLWAAPDHYYKLHWFNAEQTMVYPPPGTYVEYIFAAQTTPHPLLLSMADGLEPVGEVRDPFGRVAFSTYEWPAGALPPAPEFSGPLYWSAESDYPELLGEDAGATLVPIEAPVDVGHDVWFLGYDLSRESVPPGDPLEIVLHWQVQNLPDRPYTVFVHLIDAHTETYANGDANLYQTLFWSEGETFTGHHVLWTPPEMPPGDYLIQIGMYNPDTSERATVYDDTGAPVDARVLIGPVAIGP